MSKTRARRLIKLITTPDGTQKPIANRAMTFRASSILLRTARKGRLNDCAQMVLGEKAASSLWSKPTIHYLKSIGMSIDKTRSDIKQFPLAVNNRSEIWDTFISILAKLGFYEEAFRAARRTETMLTSLFSSVANAIKRKRYPPSVLPANNTPYVRALRLMTSKLNPAPESSKSLYAPLSIEHVNAMMQCATLANDYQMVFEKLYSKLAHVRSSFRSKERSVLQSILNTQSQTPMKLPRTSSEPVFEQTTVSQNWLVNRLESFQAETTRRSKPLTQPLQTDLQALSQLKESLPLLSTLRPDTITYTQLFDACTHRYHFLQNLKSDRTKQLFFKKEDASGAETSTSASFQDALQIWSDFHQDLSDSRLLLAVSKHMKVPKERLDKCVKVDEEVVGSFLGTFQCAESTHDIELGMKIFATLVVGGDENGARFWKECNEWIRKAKNSPLEKTTEKEKVGLLLKVRDGKFDVLNERVIEAPENNETVPATGDHGLLQKMPSLSLPFDDETGIFSKSVVYPKLNATHLTILVKLLHQKLELGPKNILGIYEYLTLGRHRNGVLTRLYDQIASMEIQDAIKLAKKLRKSSNFVNLSPAYRRIQPDLQSDLYILQILSSYDSPKLAKLGFIWFHEMSRHWSSPSVSNSSSLPPSSLPVQAYNFFFKTCKSLSLLSHMEETLTDFLELANTSLTSSPSTLSRRNNRFDVSSHTLLPIISLYVATKNPIHAVDLFEHVRQGSWGEKWAGLGRLKAWCEEDVKRPREDVKVSEAIVRYAYWGIDMAIRQKRGQEEKTSKEAKRVLKYVTTETNVDELKRLKREYEKIWKRIKNERLKKSEMPNEQGVTTVEVPKQTAVGSTPKWLREKFQEKASVAIDK